LHSEDDKIKDMSRPNVFDASFEYDDDDPSGYRSGQARIGTEAGGRENAVKLFELPAGQALCPYHYEYVEEWLIVLEGDGVVIRTPDAPEEALAKGDVVCFAAGPDGAHKVLNRGDDTARVLMFSSAREPAVSVYPDSDKIGVWSGNDADRFMFRRKDAGVDYWADEPLR
jgi:uncharacterized cupin superfamily protein